jgi:3-carboxy-cis,cis-muconate cycloisomerase
MTDLLWPGDERAGALFSDAALLAAMVRVESVWLDALVEFGVADPAARADLTGLITVDDLGRIADAAEDGGNPVIPLVALLRARASDDSAAWLHKGLTSQDVLDTALMLCSRDVVQCLRDEIATQVRALADLAEQHRHTVMAGRTLTQHAVPITFGLKAATWADAVLDADDELGLVGAALPGQFGGAAGTLAATTELAARAGLADPPGAARAITAYACAELGLHDRAPWSTSRAPVTRLGDALVRCNDAWGRLANDVLTLSRPEIAELAEPAVDGRGTSSTMPHKANPILSVLIRRAALAAPGTAAQLHLAAAEARDERPDGAWHLEWATLRQLARRTVVAAAQASGLLAGLRVDPDAMRAHLSDDLLAERDALPGVGPPGAYLGATDLIVDALLDRAKPYRNRR